MLLCAFLVLTQYVIVGIAYGLCDTNIPDANINCNGPPDSQTSTTSSTIDSSDIATSTSISSPPPTTTSNTQARPVSPAPRNQQEIGYNLKVVKPTASATSFHTVNTALVSLPSDHPQTQTEWARIHVLTFEDAECDGEAALAHISYDYNVRGNVSSFWLSRDLVDPEVLSFWTNNNGADPQSHQACDSQIFNSTYDNLHPLKKDTCYQIISTSTPMCYRLGRSSTMPRGSRGQNSTGAEHQNDATLLGFLFTDAVLANVTNGTGLQSRNAPSLSSITGCWQSTGAQPELANATVPKTVTVTVSQRPDNRTISTRTVSSPAQPATVTATVTESATAIPFRAGHSLTNVTGNGFAEWSPHDSWSPGNWNQTATSLKIDTFSGRKCEGHTKTVVEAYSKQYYGSFHLMQGNSFNSYKLKRGLHEDEQLEFFNFGVAQVEKSDSKSPCDTLLHIGSPDDNGNVQSTGICYPVVGGEAACFRLWHYNKYAPNMWDQGA